MICTLCIVSKCYIVLIPHIADDIMRPLLLSAVSSPSSNFTTAVNDAIIDIVNGLNGSNVNLTLTLYKYTEAVILSKLSIDANISDGLKDCVSQTMVNHMFSKLGSVSELVELFQNISVVIRIFKQVVSYSSEASIAMLLF